MKRNYYDFSGNLLLEVRGEGGRSTQQFRTMYHHFEVPQPDREPDMVVERTTEQLSCETVLGDPTSHYGWTGDRFVIRSGSDYMAVEPGWNHIYVTPDWEPFYAIYPVEFRIRQHVLDSETALVHASGVTLDGETTLFPAWRGGGKTNTLLSLLREGADYMADDRLWVSADGEAQGFPLSVNLQPYNIDSFPEIEITHDNVKDEARAMAYQFIDERVNKAGSVFEKGIHFLNNKFLKDTHRSFTDVGSLFPQSSYVDRSSVDNIVFLQAAPSNESVRVEPISIDDAVSAVSAISFYEWNERLEEYFRAYDALVPGGTMVAELQAVVDAEERIFRSLFEGVETYRGWIPRKADWGASGTDQEVVSAIRTLPQKKAVKADD